MMVHGVLFVTDGKCWLVFKEDVFLWFNFFIQYRRETWNHCIVVIRRRVFVAGAG